MNIINYAVYDSAIEKSKLLENQIKSNQIYQGKFFVLVLSIGVRRIMLLLSCTQVCMWVAYPDNSPGGQFSTVQVWVLMSGFYSVVVVLVGSCPGGE